MVRSRKHSQPNTEAHVQRKYACRRDFDRTQANAELFRLHAAGAALTPEQQQRVEFLELRRVRKKAEKASRKAAIVKPADDVMEAKRQAGPRPLFTPQRWKGVEGSPNGKGSKRAAPQDGSLCSGRGVKAVKRLKPLCTRVLLEVAELTPTYEELCEALYPAQRNVVHGSVASLKNQQLLSYDSAGRFSCTERAWELLLDVANGSQARMSSVMVTGQFRRRDEEGILYQRICNIVSGVAGPESGRNLSAFGGSGSDMDLQTGVFNSDQSGDDHIGDDPSGEGVIGDASRSDCSDQCGDEGDDRFGDERDEGASVANDVETDHMDERTIPSPMEAPGCYSMPQQMLPQAFHVAASWSTTTPAVARPAPTVARPKPTVAPHIAKQLALRNQVGSCKTATSQSHLPRSERIYHVTQRGKHRKRGRRGKDRAVAKTGDAPPSKLCASTSSIG